MGVIDLDALRGEAERFAAEMEPEFERFEGAGTVEAEIESFRLAHDKLRAGGWFDFVVPESLGGRAVGALATPDSVCVRALAVIRQAFAFRHAMLDLAFVEQGLGSFPIALHRSRAKTTGESDSELVDALKKTAEGALIPALGLTEPGAGSDLSGVATTATLQASGDYVLNGAKTYITNVGVADYYTVLARTSGEPGERGGLTMFYVPHRSEGLATRSFRVMAPHPIGEVLFDGVKVPARYVLGEVGAGMDLALSLIHI